MATRNAPRERDAVKAMYRFHPVHGQRAEGDGKREILEKTDDWEGAERERERERERGERGGRRERTKRINGEQALRAVQ
jgi:hypothetical protein